MGATFSLYTLEFSNDLISPRIFGTDCHHAYCTKKSSVLTLLFFSGHDTPWPLGPWQHTARCFGMGYLQSSSICNLSMLFCSFAAYGGYPCFTHMLMYYRGMGNGIFFEEPEL